MTDVRPIYGLGNPQDVLKLLRIYEEREQDLVHERDEAVAQRDELARVVQLMLDEYEDAAYGSDHEDRAKAALGGVT